MYLSGIVKAGALLDLGGHLGLLSPNPGGWGYDPRAYDTRSPQMV